jgi:hypothetical protein
MSINSWTVSGSIRLYRERRSAGIKLWKIFGEQCKFRRGDVVNLQFKKYGNRKFLIEYPTSIVDGKPVYMLSVDGNSKLYYLVCENEIITT